MDKPIGLYEKIYNVMCDSEAVEKSMVVGSGKNSYKAVSEAAMLNMVKPLFKKYKLIIFPVDGDIKDNVMTWDKTDYDGKTSKTLRAMTELKVMYRILDVESGEYQDVVGFGNGADSQDKGAGKAFTYSLKNALSKTFMLFSGEDTDNTHSDDINKGTEKPTQTPKPQGDTNTPSELINEAQAKRMFAISKGNAGIVKTVLLAHKHTESKQVLKSEYEKICKEIETLVKGA
jgi:hypothetical protein